MLPSTTPRVIKPTHLIAVAVVIAGLGVALVNVAKSQGVERSWAESLAYADEVQPTLEAIDYTREALWGETEAGSAFDAYRTAVDLLLPSGDAEGPGSNEVLNMLMHASEARQGVGNEYSEKQADKAAEFMTGPGVLATFEALSRGAHFADARPDIDWATPRESWRVLIDRRLIALAARHRFQTLAEGGRGVEAAQLLLDVAQMGLDHLRAPLPVYHGIGQAILIGAFYGPHGGQCELDALDRDGRMLLLSGLTQTIDQTEPSMHLADGDITYFIRYADRFGGLPEGVLKPEDGAMPRDGLADWLTNRRALVQGAGEAVPFRELEDSRTLIRDRLRALEFALRLDLEGRALPVSDHTGLELAGEITAETVEVNFHPSGPKRLQNFAISLRRSAPE